MRGCQRCPAAAAGRNTPDAPCLCLTRQVARARPYLPSHSGTDPVKPLMLPHLPGSTAPLRQNVSCPQRRIDQPPPPCSAPPGPPRGRTPPNIMSGVGSSAYPPRPASGSMISSSPDWPNSSQSRLRQTSSSSKGDSPEKRPAAKVSRLAACRLAAPLGRVWVSCFCLGA